MIIDFHNHFYPPEFIDAVRTEPSNFTDTEPAKVFGGNAKRILGIL